MIPQNLIRTPKARPNLPLPVAIAGGVVVALVALFVAVALCTGSAPTQVDVVVPLALK